MDEERRQEKDGVDRRAQSEQHGGRSQEIVQRRRDDGQHPRTRARQQGQRQDASHPGRERSPGVTVRSGGEHGTADREGEIEPERKILDGRQEAQRFEKKSRLSALKDLPEQEQIQFIDGRVGDEESARDEGRDSDERVADHVRALGLHIAEQESPVGKDLRQEGESARPHAEQFRHQEMTQFVQQHAREEEHREETDRQTWVARDDEEDRLNLTVQKPLEENQRR